MLPLGYYNENLTRPINYFYLRTFTIFSYEELTVNLPPPKELSLKPFDLCIS